MPLLQCKGSLGVLSIVELAFSVLIAYAWKIKKDGCDLAEYLRMPDVYFSSKYSLTQRIAQPRKAKKMLEQIRVM